MLGSDGVHDGQHSGIADILVIGVHGILDFIKVLGIDIGQQGMIQLHGGKALLRLADLGHNAVDEGEHLLDFLMTGTDGAHHGLLIDLVGTGLDHDDLFLAGSKGQGEVAVLALLLGGVQHDLTVHQTDKDTCNGAVPRNVRHGDGQRGAVHAGDLCGAVGVKAHDSHRDADIVAHVLGNSGRIGRSTRGRRGWHARRGGLRGA
mgnify:CR=1 FL=1